MRGWGLNAGEMERTFVQEYGFEPDLELRSDGGLTGDKRLALFNLYLRRFLIEEIQISPVEAKKLADDVLKREDFVNRKIGKDVDDVNLTPKCVINYLGRRLVTAGILPVPELTMDEINAGVRRDKTVALDVGNEDLEALDEAEFSLNVSVDLICKYVEANPDRLMAVVREIYAMTSFENRFLLEHSDLKRKAVYQYISKMLFQGEIMEISAKLLEFRFRVLQRLSVMAGEEVPGELLS